MKEKNIWNAYVWNLTTVNTVLISGKHTEPRYYKAIYITYSKKVENMLK
jgi:hypothetical protein